MADISKITTPDGNQYDIKDSVAREINGVTVLNFRWTIGGQRAGDEVYFSDIYHIFEKVANAYDSGKPVAILIPNVSCPLPARIEKKVISDRESGYYIYYNYDLSYIYLEDGVIFFKAGFTTYQRFTVKSPDNYDPNGGSIHLFSAENKGITMTDSNGDTEVFMYADPNNNVSFGDKMKTALCDLLYPVGSIYMSASNTSPATLFGGTWEAWGSGRVPVGVDANQTEFDTVEKTGGGKTTSYTPAGSNAAVTLTAAQSGVPSHSHTYTRPTVSSSGKITNGITGGSHTHQVDRSNAGAGVTTWGLVRDGAHGGAVLLVQNYSGSHYNVQSTTHTHDLPNHTHTLTGGGVANNTAANATESHNHAFTGTTADISTVQPYITCYMWKRTA